MLPPPLTALLNPQLPTDLQDRDLLTEAKVRVDQVLHTEARAQVDRAHDLHIDQADHREQDKEPAQVLADHAANIAPMSLADPLLPDLYFRDKHRLQRLPHLPKGEKRKSRARPLLKNTVM